MIQISQLKLKLNHTQEDLTKAVQKALKFSNPVTNYTIVKKSVDARKKDDIKIIYAVKIKLEQEEKLVKRANSVNIILVNDKTYKFPVTGRRELVHSPIIVGCGPAGLFCGLMLAKAGYKPIILEQGEDVDTRVKDIDKFWETNELKPFSNVQFGEGGAGTFSDGKLNTLVKDKFGRNKEVLKTFVDYGAPEEILYINKPHIGTDVLRTVVKNMRNAIISYGGEVRFQTKVTDLVVENGTVKGVVTQKEETITCDHLILAVGHSARDTFALLYEKQLTMESKAFAIGVRIEHPAHMINQSQYGMDYDSDLLPTADYKLAHQAANGRSVYSFCMCPGGYVVNSSSEPGRVVVNGMSNYKRDADNSNSAIIVNVTPADFKGDSPLAGVEFQRHWEEMTYKVGGNNGNVPIQLFKDFKNNETSTQLGKIIPSLKGNYSLANLNECLPSYVIDAIIDGVLQFEHKIKGFAQDDSILSGIESRTSSPLRIVRDEQFESNIKGIYPCGEGAGYAGGITSAAMDGIKTAEAIAAVYSPF